MAAVQPVSNSVTEEQFVDVRVGRSVALATDPGGVLTFEQCGPGRDHGWLGRDLQLLGSGLRDSQDANRHQADDRSLSECVVVDL